MIIKAEQIAFSVHPDDKIRIRILAEREGEAMSVICRKIFRLGLATLDSTTSEVSCNDEVTLCKP